MRQIILASKSPRRKELLKNLGIKFKIASPAYKENSNELTPEKTALVHAEKKAEEIALKYKDAIIIACDTIGAYKNQIIGKPRNKTHALEILKFLNGSRHQVLTGICIIDTRNRKKLKAVSRTYVKFTRMTDQEMKAYIGSEEGRGKAAGYAIQGLGSLFVEKIEGDYFNVVGLPIFKLTQMLKKFGVNVLAKYEKIRKIHAD